MAEFTYLRDRLNKFFMSFVSEMVFSSEPEPEVLHWVVERVSYQNVTRQFSLFNCYEVIDPNPVLRSFLLKLLLKCRQSDTVVRHLNSIIEKWQTDNIQSQVQTLILLMDCYKVLILIITCILR